MAAAPNCWIDSHCHLDAPEFGAHALAVRAQAAEAGVGLCVIPAVEVANFDAVRNLAHATGDAYCLGIHPLYVPQASKADLAVLEAQLQLHRDDTRLVAVGEIGLDYFVPALCEPAMREKQEFFFRTQLVLARRFGLPVVLHVRRSVDRVLKHLREVGVGQRWSGIAHAFNGSDVQAQALIAQGLKLGFGGAVTFERALQLRKLASTLDLNCLVLETDAPDIPPHWLYTPAAERGPGWVAQVNAPAQLPHIGAVVATLRALKPFDLAQATSANAVAALPRLAALLV
jgi:TatD DNase family protein